MDVPSIGSIIATHKPQHKNLASLASDEDTWYLLAQRRFGIGCNHKRRTWRKKKKNNVVLVKRGSSSSLSSEASTGSGENRRRRPQTYGGATWKDAFRSLSLAMRIPETSLTSGSAAKSGGAVFASPSNRWWNKRSTLLKNSNGAQPCQQSHAWNYLGIWCMLNHAENCQTKICTNSANRRRRQAVSLPYRQDMRYIELKLCLQNTKSGFGTICIPSIDMIRIATLEEDDYFSAWGWDKCDYDYPLTFKMVKHGPWAPKLLLHQCVDSERSCDIESELDVKDAIVLRPFETVVISIHIACPFEMAYETDVLSTMSSIRIPVMSFGSPSPSHLGVQQHKHSVATARFLEEDALWEYYSQLPGGCLSLTDRSRLVPV
eukprot:scaffold6887_cov161-Skeletonema_menzelii.AAC.6